MKYMLLGKSGLRVSELCLGTMTFGTEWSFGSEKQECVKVFDKFTSLGGNFIDTANFYTNGTSECFVGEFVKPNRDYFVIATKYTLNLHPDDPNTGGNHRKSLVQSVEASLKRLQTDYIDLLWVHSWDFVTPYQEIINALDALVKSGKVLYVGISNAPAWEIARINTYAELHNLEKFVGLQIQYNLVERAAERELLPMADSMGLGIVAWSPLAAGILTGKYNHQEPTTNNRLTPDSFFAKYLNERNLKIAEEVTQIAHTIGAKPSHVALRWLMSTSCHAIPILGARNLVQLEENLGVLEIELNPAHMDRLHEVSQIELGYPHDFLYSNRIQTFIFGNNLLQ